MPKGGKDMKSELKDTHYKFYGESSLYDRIKRFQKYGGLSSISAALRELVLIGLKDVEPLLTYPKQFNEKVET